MVSNGEEIYMTYCGACHLNDGKGDGLRFPPLDSSEFVMGDKNKLIEILLNGLRQPITVRGKEWNNLMPSHSFLTDDQLASVLTYVRNNFGHSAEVITAEEIGTKRNKPVTKK